MARKATKKPFSLPRTASRPALLKDGSDQDFRQFIYDLSTLTRRLDVVRGVLARRVFLTPPQYNILMVVAQAQGTEEDGDEGVSVSAVARRLHVSTAFVTTQSACILELGLLEKRPNPKDRRGVLLRLTPRAEQLVAGLAPDLVELNDMVFRGLSRQEFTELARIIAKLVDRAQEAVDSVS